MVGQKYVWLMPAGLSSAWIFSPNDFSKQHKVVKCNIRTIIEAADGFIMSDKIPIRQDSNKTLSGLVSCSLCEIIFSLLIYRLMSVPPH